MITIAGGIILALVVLWIMGKAWDSISDIFED